MRTPSYKGNDIQGYLLQMTLRDEKEDKMLRFWVGEIIRSAVDVFMLVWILFVFDSFCAFAVKRMPASNFQNYQNQNMNVSYESQKKDMGFFFAEIQWLDPERKSIDHIIFITTLQSPNNMPAQVTTLAKYTQSHLQ